jgi:acyl-CoA thioester hydrolase
MVIQESKVRVRYGETDKMGYCYYGVYAQYFEIGRTEMMRKFGLTYKEIEEKGIMLPVLSLNVKYIKPAYYDDELTIRTFLTKLPSIRIEFLYEIYNQNNELLNKGDTTLVFINALTRKPVKAPINFLEKLAPFFND